MRIEACWAFEAMFLCTMWLVAHASADAGGKPPMARPPMNTSRYAYPGPDGRLVYPELLLRTNAQIGDGVWDSFGTLVEPRSLYEKQLEDRLGVDAAIKTRYRIDWNKVFGREVRSRSGI